MKKEIGVAEYLLQVLSTICSLWNLFRNLCNSGTSSETGKVGCLEIPESTNCVSVSLDLLLRSVGTRDSKQFWIPVLQKKFTYSLQSKTTCVPALRALFSLQWVCGCLEGKAGQYLPEWNEKRKQPPAFFRMKVTAHGNCLRSLPKGGALF